MTVTGVTSADVATTSYVPPFKYVTSYAPAPLVTGTVTGAIPRQYQATQTMPGHTYSHT
ncbi:hypothetical protein BCR39DRAFT_562338 [Naematelia encephala]|uniref:Uncharacterized protein n=1 Tax=Naematelia encephala TaxID=71784 RepID=A0A1Y2AIQ4_9TREE|nr:hypothetical protein BCR39DRAFT_562338 [Naematelia encephala]